MAFWISTKSCTNVEGLSCCYRQWRATHNRSNLLHGTALSFKFVFECHQLDENDWTFDDSHMTHIKDWLRTQFDHTALVAADDPELAMFKQMSDKNLCDLRVLPGVGCEKFAEHVFIHVMTWLHTQDMTHRVTIRSVECIEHDGNSALYVE